MPRTQQPSSPIVSRRTKAVAALGAIALLAAMVQLLPSAGAGDIVIRQIAGRADSGSVDVNRDGTTDFRSYGARSRSLAIGEVPRDGDDLRLFVPFAVSAEALAAMRSGGTASVSMRVWRVANLGTQKVVVDGMTTRASGVTASSISAAHSRAETRLVTLAPVRGRMAFDVSKIVRAMKRPGTLTVRMRLERPAPEDGVRTQVNIATSESHNQANRPVLSVSTLGHPSTTSPAVPPSRAPASSTTTRPPAPSTTTTTTTSPPATSEVFRDDFSGSALDLAKWRPNWLAGTDDAITKPVNSRELSCYDPAQVSVSGGYLHLNAAVRSCRANNGITYPYASGLVESAHDFTFTYGRVEARIFVPSSGGAISNWPAFWTNGTGTWPITGENDIMEGLEGRACWHFHSTLGGPGDCAAWSDQGGWHTFAAEWRPGVVTYFYDGAQVGRITSGITASPMYLIFNLGVSTSIAPPVRLPAEMLVDWVRVTR